jgi:uncharacterized SAM-dependent methyltransferase
MSSVVNVAIHASQFPERIARDLSESLRTRQINHKFLYESYRQSQKWLAVHQTYSPWKTDSSLPATYDASFAGAIQRVKAGHIHVIGLGCGTGEKDARLIQMLQTSGKEPCYSPVDVSLALVLRAHNAAAAIIHHPRSAIGNPQLSGLVCDLGSADDLKSVFNQHTPVGAMRLLTFFGMIPNFEPQLILPRLRSLVREQDLLLLSANLAPANDYEAAVRRILPQYDNALTRDWLLTFLLDLGAERSDGELEWLIESDPEGGDLLRLTTVFRLTQSGTLRLGEETFKFQAGETIRLFFSYRYTPERLRAVLRKYGLSMEAQWITDPAEEGVFLCTAR